MSPEIIRLIAQATADTLLMVAVAAGLGAVLGLFHAVGYGWVGDLALIGGFRKLANALADGVDPSVPKTKSDASQVPAWWVE